MAGEVGNQDDIDHGESPEGSGTPPQDPLDPQGPQNLQDTVLPLPGALTFSFIIADGTFWSGDYTHSFSPAAIFIDNLEAGAISLADLFRGSHMSSASITLADDLAHLYDAEALAQQFMQTYNDHQLEQANNPATALMP
jgi:hypothetical protein